MNTALLLNNIYDNFINDKNNSIHLNNIKQIDDILKNINIKCKNIVDDLLKNRDNFEKKHFKYIIFTLYY